MGIALLISCTISMVQIRERDVLQAMPEVGPEMSTVLIFIFSYANKVYNKMSKPITLMTPRPR